MNPANLTESLLEKVKELEYSNKNLRSYINTLSNEMQSMESQLAAPDEEKIQLENQLRQLRAKLNSIIEERETVIAEVKENCAQQNQKLLDKALESHQKQLNDVNDLLIQAREETARIRKELEYSRKREKDLRQEIGTIQHNLENEIVKNEELREELEDFRSTNKAMRDEIDHLNKEKESITQKMVRKENDFEDIKSILSIGGNVDLSFTNPTVDVCSEIFDKDNLTESQLSSINKLHPIDASLENLSPIIPPNKMLTRRSTRSPITSTERKQPIRLLLYSKTSTDEQECTILSNETTQKSTANCSTKFITAESERPQFGPFCFLFITFLLFCYTLIVYPLKYTYHYLIATILLPGLKVERISSCQ